MQLLYFQHEDENTRIQAIADADVIIVCYSIVDRESFENVKSFWIHESRKYNKKKPVILVATQSDVRKENNLDHVTDVEGQTMIKTINAEYYNKCSSAAKTGMKNVFESAVLASIKYKKKKSSTLRRVFGRWRYIYPCPEIIITFIVFCNVIAPLVLSGITEIVCSQEFG